MEFRNEERGIRYADAEEEGMNVRGVGGEGLFWKISC